MEITYNILDDPEWPSVDNNKQTKPTRIPKLYIWILVVVLSVLVIIPSILTDGVLTGWMDFFHSSLIHPEGAVYVLIYCPALHRWNSKN